MNLKHVLALCIAVLISEFTGFLGALFTAPSISTWYGGLMKSALTPPAWIFAPVWLALFFLMGVAAFLVWSCGIARQDVKRALALFGVQLLLNILWSAIFFGLQNPGLAFFELIILWVVICWTMILFFRISFPAGWLLVPYVLWVSFAGYLNYVITLLN